jgi:hypothetical protein
MEEDKLIDQSVLAEDVASKIPYSFRDFFLVKPLDPVKVKKEFSTPVDTTVKEDDGMKVEEFQEVAKEVKEVDSDYRKGIVLKRPLYYDNPENTHPRINVGDTVLFRDQAGLWFDMIKDSKLLRQYDILGVVK